MSHAKAIELSTMTNAIAPVQKCIDKRKNHSAFTMTNALTPVQKYTDKHKSHSIVYNEERRFHCAVYKDEHKGHIDQCRSHTVIYDVHRCQTSVEYLST